MDMKITGGEAIAAAVLAAGATTVLGYPGAPATNIVNAILKASKADDVLVEWTSNEKVAIEMLFGASLTGHRSLLCVKGVGLNIALDPLMAINLSGCNAGLVLFVGDDPGGWGSQNEQDSRALAYAAEVPIIEPGTVKDACSGMLSAFRLSEEIEQPVMFRVTRALVQAEISEGEIHALLAANDQDDRPQIERVKGFERVPMKWVVLPINVQEYHERVHVRLEEFRSRFEGMSLNDIYGDGTCGIIASGFVFQKLIDLFGDEIPAALRVLKLGCVYPLPEKLLASFLSGLNSVLVLEETAPLVERAVRAFIQKSGDKLVILGRDTGHVPSAGEIFMHQISAALKNFGPGFDFVPLGPTDRPLPSREPLCENCAYIPTFEALIDVMERHGGRDKYIVVGDPGCMVKSQLEPFSLLDVKNSLGSSVAMGAGISLALESGPGSRLDDGDDTPEPQHVIAISGDSGFLHSGLNGLIDACRMGVTMLLIVLDNGTTALSGGQAHPASQRGIRGEVQSSVDLGTVIRAVGVDVLRIVDLDEGEDIRDVLDELITANGVSVVIARGECVRYPAEK